MLADKLGFDAIVVNEHHNTVYSMMATPNLIAAALVPQTKRAKICVWGTPPNLMLPNRLAEEYAILDVMSNGRLEVAFPLGTGMEYWANPVNPATARDKFRESLKIILQAWTADGPTTHYGNALHLSLPQSLAAADAAAASALLHRRHRQPGDDRHRRRIRLRLLPRCSSPRSARASSTRTCASAPRISATPSGPSSCRSSPSSTSRRPRNARGQEYVPHLQAFFEDYLRTTPQYLAPPGYLSVDQLKIRAAGADKMHGGFDFDLLSKAFFIAVGTPEKVANQLGHWAEWMGSNHINAVMHVADMPHWKTVKNLTLFAEEVIPRLRKGAPQQIAAE